MSYGLPYMGSKNKIAEWVLEQLPEAENLYDLFGGGGAITHCAALSGKYQNIYYNDIQKNLTKLFKDAVEGKYADEKRWISREDFFDEKNKDDMYIKTCWSFGNNCNGYMYNKEIEPFKKAVHYAIVFKDHSLLADMDIIIKLEKETINERKIEFRKIAKEKLDKYNIPIKSLETLQSLKSLNRLERLQNLQNLEGNIIYSEKSYKDIEIKENSIIYCDIPYKNTGKYNNRSFDYDEFYKWACSQSVPVYISEYSMPEDKFECIAEKEKRCHLGDTNNKKTIEKIFIPKK